MHSRIQQTAPERFAFGFPFSLTDEVILIRSCNLHLIFHGRQIAVSIKNVPRVAGMDTASVYSPRNPKAIFSCHLRIPSKDIFAGVIVPPRVTAFADVGKSLLISRVIAIALLRSLRVRSVAVFFFQQGDAIKIFIVDHYGPSCHGVRLLAPQLCFEFIDLRLKVGGLFRAVRTFEVGPRSIPVVDACEKSLQAVVVGLRDGIKFVIVAAGTAYRHAKEGCPCSDDDFVECVLPCKSFGSIVSTDLTRQQDRSRNQEAGGLMSSKRISRKLFSNELVIG